MDARARKKRPQAARLAPPPRYEGFTEDIQTAVERHLDRARKRLLAAKLDLSTPEAALAARHVYASEKDDLALAAALRHAFESTATLAARAGLDLTSAHKVAKAAPKYEDALDLVNENAVTWAQQHAAALVTAINDTTWRQINELVVTTVEGGFGHKELAEAIRTNLAFTRARAEMIARTEIQFANVAGNLIGYRASGTEQKEWLVADSDVCDDCLMMDGTVEGIDAPFTLPSGEEVDGPPAHPRCRCDCLPVVVLPSYDTEPPEETPGERGPAEEKPRWPVVPAEEPTPEKLPDADLAQAVEDLGGPPAPDADPMAFHEAHAEEHGEFMDGLAEAVRDALARFQRDAAEVNAALREGEVAGEIAGRVAAITTALAAAPVLSSTAFTVYRAAPAALAASLSVGSVLKDLAFTTTVIDPAGAAAAGMKSGTLLRIKLPAGTQGLYLSAVATPEVLLQRGAEFKVTNIARAGEWTAVDVDYLGSTLGKADWASDTPRDEGGRWTGGSASSGRSAKPKRASATEEKAYRQKKAERALASIPRRYRGDMKLKIVPEKIADEQGFQARTSPGSDLVEISDGELMDRIPVENHTFDMDARAPRRYHPTIYGDSSFAEERKYQPDEEMSAEHIRGILLHEVGHKVWERLPSELRMKLHEQMAGIEVRSATLAGYRGWIAERQEAWRESHGRSPVMLDSRYGREQFAEMFRHYQQTGKYTGFFKPVERALDAAGKAAEPEFTKGYDPDQPRDEHGRWMDVPDLPPAPGEAPLKPGHVRLYHQTDAANIEAIRAEGILHSRAKGIEGPRRIYADRSPHYGDASNQPTVEFQVPEDQFDAPYWVTEPADKYGTRMPREKIDPSEFIAIHEPWHAKARYIEKNPEVRAQVLAGEHDDLMSMPDYGPAIAYIKRKYGDRPAKAEHYGIVGGPKTLDDWLDKTSWHEGWLEWEEVLKLHPANYVPRDEHGRFITIGMARSATTQDEHYRAEKFHEAKAKWLREVKHDEPLAILHDNAAKLHHEAATAFNPEATKEAQDASALADAKPPKKPRKAKSPKDDPGGQMLMPGIKPSTQPQGSPPEVPDFQTVDDLKKWTHETYGVEVKVAVSTSVDPLELLKPSVRALSEAHFRGAAMPVKIIVTDHFPDHSPMPPSTPAATDYGPNGKSPPVILINPYAKWWTDERPKDPKWCSGAGAEYPMIHELGHVGHSTVGDFKQIVWHPWGEFATLTPSEKDVALKVSKYATVMRAEFVAEVFAGNYYGKEYDDDVWAMYEKYKGPKTLRPRKKAAA